MPFVVKPTYRLETRKFTFNDGHFPTWDELCHQISRIFGISPTQTIYLSKIIFSPQESAGGIMIGMEAHSAAQYDVHCRSFSGRIFNSGRLTFTIHLTPEAQPLQQSEQLVTAVPELPPLVYPSGSVPYSSQPLPNSAAAAFLPFMPSLPPPPPPPPQAMRHLHSQRISEYRSSVAMDVDAEQPGPLTECCSNARTKKEMQEIMDDFLRNFRRVMSSSGFTAGQSFFDPLDTPTRPASPLPPLSLDASLHIPGSFMEPCPQSSPAETTDQEKNQVPPRLDPTMTLHPGIWCDHCGKQIKGLRFNCQECPEYDLCANCIVVSHALDKHNADKPSIHKFNTISPPSQESRRARWGEQISIVNPVAPHPSRPEVIVEVRTETDPAVHYGIVCDLCNQNGIRGPRFKCMNCQDYDLCDICIGRANSEHESDHRFLRIDEPSRVRFHSFPSPTSGNPEIVSFHHARCNLCDSRIAGARYKCTDCPDFDTCSRCFAITPEQHPNHTFVKVTDPKHFMLRRTPQPVAHFATCDGCRKRIIGNRFKCMHPDCPDFDLCENCEALPIPVHPLTHPLLKLRHDKAYIPVVQRNVLLPQPQLQAHVDALVQTTQSMPQELPNDLDSASTSVYQTPDSSSPIPSVPEPQPQPQVKTVPAKTSQPEEKTPVSDTNPFADPHPFDLFLGTRIGAGYAIPSNSTGALNAAAKEEVDAAAQEEPKRPEEPEVKVKTVEEEILELEQARRRKHTEAFIQRAPAPSVVPPPLPPAFPPGMFPPLPVQNLSTGSTSPAPSSPEMSQKSQSFFARSFMNQTASSLGAVFISDNNIPDGHVFPPGAEFVKSWRVKNVGSEVWEGVYIKHVGGDRLATGVNAQAAFPVGRVEAGEEINVAAGEMRTPETLGKCMSFWRLHDAQGRPFGPKMWCYIQVVDSDSDSSHHGSLANSSVVMPQNPSVQVPTTITNADLMSPTTAMSSVSTMSDASSVGSASIIDAQLEEDSDWDDVADAPLMQQRQGELQDGYQVVYDSGSETGRL